LSKIEFLSYFGTEKSPTTTTMSFDKSLITDSTRADVLYYFSSLIEEGDTWEDEDEDPEGDESTWKFYPNFKKIHKLLAEGKKDQKEVDHIKRFLHMYLFDDEGLLEGELRHFAECYECRNDTEAPFNLSIRWMMSYIDSDLWVRV